VYLYKKHPRNMTTAHRPVSRLKRFLVAAALYAGAVVLGLGSAWWVLKKSSWMNTTVRSGAWVSNMRAGSPDADMYTRAGVALNALLALGRDETMYFLATRDDEGKALRSACSYRIEGVAPKARWWSVTAYADDLFLFDAANKQFSLNGTNARLDAQGRFSFFTGPQAPPAGYWVPTPGDRGLILALRLYNPHPDLQASPASLQPPRIQREGACV
jgi:hypothetical protein